MQNTQPHTCATADEQRIVDLVEARRLAWNAQDTDRYAQLLDVDAELLSATGRKAYGREGVIEMYRQQREGAYRDANVVSTVVSRIKFITGDVARAESIVRVRDVRNAAGELIPLMEAACTFWLVRRSGDWFISEMAGVPTVKF